MGQRDSSRIELITANFKDTTMSLRWMLKWVKMKLSCRTVDVDGTGCDATGRGMGV